MKLPRLSLLALLAASILANVARADDCIQEHEPNDTPAQATPITAPGCIDGTLGPSHQGIEDQDFYAWTLSESDARKVWTLGIESTTDRKIAVRVYRAEPSASGVRLGSEIFALSTQEGRASVPAPNAAGDLLLTGTAYILGVSGNTSRAGAQDHYRLHLEAREPEPLPLAEKEPDDDAKSAQPVSGAFALSGDLKDSEDYYAWTLSEEDARQRWQLTLRGPLGEPLELILRDDKDRELARKRAERNGLIDLADLGLAAGTYTLVLRPKQAQATPYELRAQAEGPRSPDLEEEPNDKHEAAQRIDLAKPVHGRFTGGADQDQFRFMVEGEPQLWRIEATGQGISWLALRDAADQTEATRYGASDRKSLALSDAYLLPGEHWVVIYGENGDYTLSLVPLGPPDPHAEREPNDDETHAQPIALGEVRTGRLADGGDHDVYRFSLAAEEHVALHIEPPPDGAVTFALRREAQDVRRTFSASAGQPIVQDMLLPAGDYHLTLSMSHPSQGQYRLSVERRDPYDLPADLEPNDDRAHARPIPPRLELRGTAGEAGDDDWYRLPAAPSPTAITIARTGPVELALYDGDKDLGLTLDAANNRYRGNVPAGMATLLRVKGTGGYTLKLAFDSGINAVPAVPLGVALSLDSAADAIAAHWPQGQQLPVRIMLDNKTEKPQDLTLEARASHYAWRPVLAKTRVSLQPGRQETVPLAVYIGRDAWAGFPVQLAVRARASDGAWISATREFRASIDAPAVNPQSSWPLHPKLLGGLDVAWSALGAKVYQPATEDMGKAQPQLYTGTAPGQTGFKTSADTLPITLSVQLAGDRPVPVVGVILNPMGPGSADERLRAFDVLLSEDGTHFKSVLSGELEALPAEQGFVFPAPVPARYAQLRLRSNHNDNRGNMVLAQWKVIASPQVPLSEDKGYNLADPALGGHIVWSNPLAGGGYRDPDELLKSGGKRMETRVEAAVTPQWVIGFRHDRAAQIHEIDWSDPPDSRPERQIKAVEVAVSTESPIGPWKPLGTWTLDRNGGSVPPLQSDTPTWARFVRFTAKNAFDKGATVEYPVGMQIYERPVGPGYRSILGEWGLNSRDAVYELANAPRAPAATPTAGQNASRAQAQPLALGTAVRGQVMTGQREDWYRVDVPADADTLEVTASGDPSVTVDVSLRDGDDKPVPWGRVSASSDKLVLTAVVEPSQSYYLRVEDPPRSVVIAFDMSGSLGQFIPLIRQALVRYAGGVVPGREVVNFLPFEKDFMLRQWADRPYVLQTALTNFGTWDTSSNSETTLLKAAQALAARTGVKAILLITDASSSRYDKTSKLWEAFAEVRPRIFAAHMGSYSDPQREQQLMQDWAAVNAGYYSYAYNQAELDMAFERTAAWLRRPSSYALTAVTRTETPPKIAKVEYPPQPRPAGHIQVQSAPAEMGGLILAPQGAIELIFDASGSMLQRLQGKRRIEIARSTLSDLVRRVLPPGTPLALRAFGHIRPHSCETTLEVRLSPLDPTAVSKRIAKIQAKNYGMTPIADALEQVPRDLKAASGPKTVILVTDGEEDCEGDPAAVIASLRERGIQVTVNIVGFAIEEGTIKRELREWARLGGGDYFDAGSAEQLGAALAKAVHARFRVLTADGKVTATGEVDGDEVSVPAGSYRIEVEVAPPQRFDQITVNEGQTTLLRLGPAQY